jgi:hypothetical protein
MSEAETESTLPVGTRRPVPHILHTDALEGAAIAVCNAKDSAGKPIMLCPNPMDVHAVRDSMTEVLNWAKDPAYYCQDEGEGAEIAALKNLILLSTLLLEHLKAGNK